MWPTVWPRPDWLTPVIQRQSAVLSTSITSANVSATGTLTLLIKMPASVTFCRAHRRTFCCLPGIISLIIMCTGIIFQIITLRWQTRLTGPRLGLNSWPAARVTPYCTWRPTDMTTGLDGQGCRRVLLYDVVSGRWACVILTIVVSRHICLTWPVEPSPDHRVVLKQQYCCCCCWCWCWLYVTCASGLWAVSAAVVVSIRSAFVILTRYGRPAMSAMTVSGALTAPRLPTHTSLKVSSNGMLRICDKFILFYTVNHKKRDVLFLTITLANFDRFL